MLVGSDTARLAGFLRPLGSGAGFVLPIWRSPRSNRCLAQIVTPQGRVEGFRDIEQPDIVHADDLDFEVAIGGEALCGYGFPGEAPHFALRDELAGWLSLRLHEIADPLLYLQASQFCDLGDKVQAAWRSSYAHMRRIAPKSAEAWRDTVILPPRLRLAVSEVMALRAIDAADHDLGRDIAVSVENGQLIATYEQRLFAALKRTEGAFEDISLATRDLREAFSLGERTVERQRKTDEILTQPDEMDAEPVIVAIGALGHAATKGVNTQIFPRSLRFPGPALDMSGGPSTVTIMRGNELIWKGEDRVSPDNMLAMPLALLPEKLPVVFVFGVTENDWRTIQSAVRFAEHIGSRYHRLIAAIPHLPDPGLSKDAVRYAETISTIATCFDAICILSDQGLSTRGGAPFGPARSDTAACTRLALLIQGIAEDSIDLSGLQPEEALGCANVHLFGSIGDSNATSGSRRFNQALMRTRNSALLLDAPIRADLQLADDRGIYMPSLAKEITKREGFKARVTRHSVLRPKLSAILHLAGVRWDAAPLSSFPDACRREFERAGWRTIDGGSVLPAPDFYAVRGNTRWHVECKAFGQIDRRFKSTAKRGSYQDRIVITDSSVQRGDFIRQYLAGRILVNFSRIADLHTILRQRHGYVVRALKKHEQRYRDAFVKAAFEVVERAIAEDVPQSELPRPERPDDFAKLIVEECSLYLTSDSAVVDLAVALTPDLALQWLPRALLTPRGWCFDSFERTGEREPAAPRQKAEPKAKTKAAPPKTASDKPGPDETIPAETKRAPRKKIGIATG